MKWLMRAIKLGNPELLEALTDGWEPFAVQGLGSGETRVFVKKMEAEEDVQPK